MTIQKVKLPPKLIPVFLGEARYRGAYGGRGSAKTFSFAKMAAVTAIRHAEAGTDGVIVCAREFVSSLAESSMAEVKAAIKSEPWMADRFDIGEKYIRTSADLPGRVDFVFRGVRHNVDSIKSTARVLLFWIDEAEPVSETAWTKITPTVRADNSEIWVTWNPEEDGSPTDKRFKKSVPPNSKIVEINFDDNPWFPQVLRDEMEWDKRRDPTKYAHVWLGKYLVRSDAQVFSNWRVEEFDTPESVDRFYFGADWGFSVDPSVLVRCWIDGRTLYIDYEAYKVGCDIDDTPALFAGNCPYKEDDPKYWQNKYEYPGIPGAEVWPITADSARPETISYMRKAGFDIKSAKKGPGSVEDGIEFLKNYDIVVHPRCRHTIDELTFYRYKVDPKTDEVLPVLEDKNNHVIDACRYAVESLRRAPKVELSIVGDGKMKAWQGAI